MDDIGRNRSVALVEIRPRSADDSNTLCYVTQLRHVLEDVANAKRANDFDLLMFS